jgi:acyl-CoA reductase-like NAD-dependent aldehyde dehydrogenase
MQDILKTLRQAQQRWAAVPLAQRAQRVRVLQHVMAREAAHIASVICEETRKPFFEAVLHEVMGVAHLAHYFASHGPRILKPQPVCIRLFKHRKSYLHYVPRGVVAVIGPWNYPFSNTFGDVIMALMAGNAVVLKPSEHTPQTALLCAQLLKEAGFDPALFHVAVGGPEKGQEVLSAGVDMVHFIGSVSTGRKVAQVCGERLIPCVLELGGKDAAWVMADADLAYAADAVLWGAMANAGQICASVERVYVDVSVYPAFVEKLKEKIAVLRQGDVSEEADVGPMIVALQKNIVQSHIEQAKAQGAKVFQPEHARSDGLFMPPSLLTDVNDHMLVCAEETFGPVLPVMPVHSHEEALEKINGNVYGLSAYVFSRDEKKALPWAERIRAGTVVLNDVLLTHALPETPWGGLKQSGLGHTHGDSALRHLCEMRHVNYSRFSGLRNPWFFPYQKRLEKAAVDWVQGLFGGASYGQRLKSVWSAVKAFALWASWRSR